MVLNQTLKKKKKKGSLQYLNMMFTKYVIIVFPLEEIKDTKMVSTFFKEQQEFCEGGEKLQGHIEEAAYIRETEILQQKCYYYIKGVVVQRWSLITLFFQQILMLVSLFQKS